MDNLSPLAAALKMCIAAERATIVRYLRAHGSDLADAIAAGYHLRDVPAPTVTLAERTEHGSSCYTANSDRR